MIRKHVCFRSPASVAAITMIAVLAAVDWLHSERRTWLVRLFTPSLATGTIVSRHGAIGLYTTKGYTAEEEARLIPGDRAIYVARSALELLGYLLELDSAPHDPLMICTYDRGWRTAFGFDARIVEDEDHPERSFPSIRVPHWFLIVLALIPLMLRVRRWNRTVRAMREGRCIACGYDLRASPCRCPECGSEPSERARGYLAQTSMAATPKPMNDTGADE